MKVIYLPKQYLVCDLAEDGESSSVGVLLEVRDGSPHQVTVGPGREADMGKGYWGQLMKRQHYR